MINPVASTRLRVLAIAVVAVSLLQSGTAQAQSISTIAGNGVRGFSGDGGPGTAALLNNPMDVIVDGAGNRYIADRDNYRIRKVTPAGIISTVAGNGTLGFSGDGGPATSAQLGQVYQLAIDAGGTLYLADYNNNRVRKVTPAGVISTIAGNGTNGSSGDGGPATSAALGDLVGIAVDDAGNVYTSDINNWRIRKVTPAGIISTFAGNGTGGFSGDGGPATSASLAGARGISTDAGGNLYIADSGNYRIRKVTPAGIISTVAGNGTLGFSGDGGPATSASFSNPVWDVAADNRGNLYISDSSNYRIRKVSATGVISTVAGNGSTGSSGDGGPATDASIGYAVGVAIDTAGDLHFAAQRDHRVRKVALFTTCADEGYSGTRLSMCRKVCEIDQSPARLTMLIKLYVTNYRDSPPCAR